MASAIAHYGSFGDERGSGWSGSFDGARIGRGTDPANRMEGVEMGAACAFVRQRVMSGAKDGEENIAAASTATVQQAGIALGAAIARLVANASGLDNGLDPGCVLRASLWMPLALVAAPLRSACD